MENLDKKQGEGMCAGCGQCGYCSGMGHMHGCHGGRHHLLKIILKLLIVIIIFWCGFKLGVITGSIRGGYVRENNFGMMRGYNNYSNNVPLPNPSGGVPALPTK